MIARGAASFVPAAIGLPRGSASLSATRIRFGALVVEGVAGLGSCTACGERVIEPMRAGPVAAAAGWVDVALGAAADAHEHRIARQAMAVVSKAGARRHAEIRVCPTR